MSSLRRLDRHERGLTLLEVLAAAMIFAMVMTVLIGTSSTAVHNAGLAARRLEANIIADGIIADLEIQMSRRVAPTIEESDVERESYHVHLERSDFIPDAQGRGSATAGLKGASTEISVLLASELPEVAKHLKRYDIEVSWIEGNGAQNVTRTTFAYDWEAAAIEYAELFQAAEPDEDGEPDLDAPEALDGANAGSAR